MVQKPESDTEQTEQKEKRIDLSLPQVAGSAVAAVAAAVAASQLGVYGTIAGAGVMSVVATCGGSVFQHFFRRTGEQIREVTVQVVHPEGRQVTVHTKETTPSGRRAAARRSAPEPEPPAEDATTVLPTVDPGAVPEVVPDAESTQLLTQVAPGILTAPNCSTSATRGPACSASRRRVAGPRAAPEPTTTVRGCSGGSTARGRPAAGSGPGRRRGVRRERDPRHAAARLEAPRARGRRRLRPLHGRDHRLRGPVGQRPQRRPGHHLGQVVRGGGDHRDSGPADPTPSGDTGRDGGTDEDGPTPSASTGSAPATDGGDGSGTSTDPGTGADRDKPSTGPTPTPAPSGSTGPATPGPARPTPSAPATPAPVRRRPTPASPPGRARRVRPPTKPSDRRAGRRHRALRPRPLRREGAGPQCVAGAAGVSRRARAAGSRCRTCGPGPAGRAAP